MLGSRVVSVRAYEPSGLDLSRGYELDLQPLRTNYADCSAQRLTLYLQFRTFAERRDDPDGAAAVESLALAQRYHTATNPALPGADQCPAPRDGIWTIARDPREFHRASVALGQVQAYALGHLTGPRPDFTCEEPCADPMGALRGALRRGFEVVSFEGDTMTAWSTPGGGWVITAETDKFGEVVRSIRLRNQIPPLS
jgi:hypothetical protein